MVYYLGCSELPAEIPFDEKNPSFCLEHLDPTDKDVLVHFSKSNVVYAGSSNHCGCGFRYSGSLNEIPIIDEDSKEDHQRFGDLVSQLLDEEKSVEIFGCWSGDETCDALGERKVSLKEFRSDDFYFIEGERLIVSKNED